MNRLCYITRNYRGINGSGNKARTDNEDTIVEMGGINLGLRRTFYRSKILTFLINLAGIIRYTFSVRRGDIIILQYPIKKYFALICNIAHLRGAHTIAVVHDLGMFRRKKLTTAKEINRLMHADYVIASNKVMQRWIADNGFSNMSGALGLFDYRSTSPAATKSPYRCGHARLVYAGALGMRKNAFILSLPDIISGYSLHIYGNRDGLPALRPCDGIVFHDFAPADHFIANVDADFGLVWDGDSLDGCTGNFGEYLKYNSPHKMSFYLRAGLPIIVWRRAALAELVEQEHIGICIDSLTQLTGILNAVTPEAYSAMRDNALRVSQRLQNGHYLRTAIHTACAAIDGNK